MMMIIAVKKASISIYQSRAWRQEGSNRESVKSMHEHLTGGQAGRRQAVGKGSPFTRQEAGNAEVALLGIRLSTHPYLSARLGCTPRCPGRPIYVVSLLPVGETKTLSSRVHLFTFNPTSS